MLYSAKYKDFDRVLLEWVQQRRIECMPLTGLMVLKQARKYHEELKIKFSLGRGLFKQYHY